MIYTYIYIYIYIYRDFKSALAQAHWLLSEIAPESTLLGAQSLQSHIAGIPVMESVKQALKAMKTDTSGRAAIMTTLRASMAPTETSLLDAAGELALMKSMDENKVADLAAARSYASTIGQFIQRAMAAGVVTDALKEEMMGFDVDLPAIVLSVVATANVRGIKFTGEVIRQGSAPFMAWTPA